MPFRGTDAAQRREKIAEQLQTLADERVAANAALHADLVVEVIPQTAAGPSAVSAGEKVILSSPAIGTEQKLKNIFAFRHLCFHA